MNSVCTTARNLGAITKLNQVGVLLGLMCKYVCEECDFRVFAGAQNPNPSHVAVELIEGSILQNMEVKKKKN